jgi:hypothetical protein
MIMWIYPDPQFSAQGTTGNSNVTRVTATVEVKVCSVSEKYFMKIVIIQSSQAWEHRALHWNSTNPDQELVLC